MYEVSKLFEDLGSTCFRNHKADTHCKYLHGHNLSFKFTFASHSLDDVNWVIDFGDLKDLRQELEVWFDHTTIIAADDPHLEEFTALESKGAIRLIVIPAISCEIFAKLAFNLAERVVNRRGKDNVMLLRCEVWESGKNSASYVRV